MPRKATRISVGSSKCFVSGYRFNDTASFFRLWRWGLPRLRRRGKPRLYGKLLGLEIRFVHSSLNFGLDMTGKVTVKENTISFAPEKSTTQETQNQEIARPCAHPVPPSI
jgi:hypothetical protein